VTGVDRDGNEAIAARYLQRPSKGTLKIIDKSYAAKGVPQSLPGTTIATQRLEIDEQGLVVRATFLDAFGAPARKEEGASGERYEHDPMITIGRSMTFGPATIAFEELVLARRREAELLERRIAGRGVA
jgi:hypothetical protein